MPHLVVSDGGQLNSRKAEPSMWVPMQDWSSHNLVQPDVQSGRWFLAWDLLRSSPSEKPFFSPSTLWQLSISRSWYWLYAQSWKICTHLFSVFLSYSWDNVRLTSLYFPCLSRLAFMKIQTPLTSLQSSVPHSWLKMMHKCQFKLL